MVELELPLSLLTGRSATGPKSVVIQVGAEEDRSARRAPIRFRRERAEPEAQSQGRGGTFFDPFVPHGHFCSILSALQNKRKPRVGGAFVK
jgi:hypothetical protein